MRQRLRRYWPAQRRYSRVCMPFHWYGVCGLGTKFDTDAVTST